MDPYIRRSRILDHSLNSRTDQLYEPLRHAIREASINKNKAATQVRSSSLYNYQGSHVSKMRWDIPAPVAEKLANVILIPSNQPLVPTKDLSKIQNVNFVVIDTCVRESPAISQQQFQRRNKATIQKTVYQITSERNGQQNDYLMKTPVKNPEASEIDKNSQMTMDRTRERGKSLVSFDNPRASYLFRQSYRKEVAPIEQPFLQYGLQQKPISSKQNVNQGTDNNQLVQNNEAKTKTLKQNPLTLSKASSTSSRRNSRFLRVFSSGDVQLTQKKIENLQKFHIVASDIDKRYSEYSKKTLVSPKNQLSAIDHAVNNKCASCGSNQIIATRPANPWAS